MLLTETERESRECKFELFWDALNAVLNREGGYIHADSRRHGVDHLERPAAIQNGETTVGHNSLRHLIEVTTKYAEEQNAGNKIEIPCREYVRIQFLPRNSNVVAASRYCGRFPLTYGMQQRFVLMLCDV